MIQSGISTFPWIYTWWNRMKIGLDFYKPNPSRSDTSEAASSLSGYLRSFEFPSTQNGPKESP